MFDFQGAISTAGEHILNPDCSVRGISAADLFFAKQIAYALTPPALGLIIFALWRTYAACRGISWSDRATVSTHTIKDKMIVTLCVLLYFFWPTSLKQAFGMFSCRFVGSNRDKMYLMADFEEPCFEGRHAIYAIFVGASQIILYALGLPLLVFVFLWRHRNELNKPVVRFRYGLFFAGFRKKKYYWECIVALRKESTVILAVFGPQLGVAMLAHVALFVFIIQILIQLIGHPYDPLLTKLQMLDVTSICICWFTMWSGFFFYSPRPESQKSALIFLTMLVVLINVAHMVYLLYSMCSAACIENQDNVVLKKILSQRNSMKPLSMKPLGSVKQGSKRKMLKTRHIQNPSLGIGIEMASINESSTTQKKKTKKRRRKTDQIQLHTKSAAQTKRSDRLKDVIRRQHLEKNVDVFGMYDVGCNPLYAGSVTNETLEIDNNETETLQMNSIINISTNETDNDKIELPPDWEELKDEDGDIYYWNVETDVTQYEIPIE